MPDLKENSDRIGILFLSGNFATVHVGLMLAATHLAQGKPTLLFFTMQACHTVLRGKDLGLGWHDLQGEAAIRDDDLQKKNVGGIEELLLSCAELGGRFIVCETGLRVLGVQREQLRSDLPLEIAGMMTLLNATHHLVTF